MSSLFKYVLGGLGLAMGLLGPCAYATSYTYTTVSMPGASQTSAVGINDNGAIVGMYGNGILVFSSILLGSVNGFLDNNGTYTTLTVPFAGVSDTTAHGINNNGTIIGSYTDSSGIGHAFLDNNGSYTTFTVPFAGASSIDVSGINNNGAIVGTYNDSSGMINSFLDNGGTFTSLNVPGSSSTSAYGINNSGTIVGIYVDSSGTHSFLDNGGVFTAFAVPGASFSQVLGINNNGDIVGISFNSSGQQYSFLATPVPEPATSWLMGAGLLVLVGGVRRKGKGRDKG